MGITAQVDSERRLRLPDEWRDEFPPGQAVEMVLCDEGVLVKPLRRTALQAALARTFPMNRPSHLDLSNLDMDALAYGGGSEDEP